jgi:hypothetical protein
MMKTIYGAAGFLLLLSITACNFDPGPVESSSSNIDSGGAESVRADIRMGAGELHIEGGASKLLNASYHYSENIGAPVVRYDVTGAHGQLTVESPKHSQSGDKATNIWDLQMTSDIPLDMTVNLGAGESTLDLSQLLVRSVDVNMGVGEMTLNLAGKYKRDVTARVNGGVGEAKIRLPKELGVEVKATGGIGSIETTGLTRRDGKYYNNAYADDKPALHMEVQGGIGAIHLNVE